MPGPPTSGQPAGVDWHGHRILVATVGLCAAPWDRNRFCNTNLGEGLCWAGSAQRGDADRSGEDASQWLVRGCWPRLGC
jgi:hypothetical protein